MSEVLSRVCKAGHGLPATHKFCQRCGELPFKECGRYRVVYAAQKMPVTATHLRSSEKVGEVSKDDVVDVLKFWEQLEDERIRAYIASPQGWITFADNGFSYMFVEGPQPPPPPDPQPTNLQPNIKVLLDNAEVRKKAKEILLEGGDVYPANGDDAIIYCTGKAKRDCDMASEWKKMVDQVQTNINKGPELKAKLAQQEKERNFQGCQETADALQRNKICCRKLLDEIVLLDRRRDKIPDAENNSKSVLEEMKTVLIDVEKARNAVLNDLKDKTNRQPMCLLSRFGCSKPTYDGSQNAYCGRNHLAMSEFKVGANVEAKYKGGQYHSATVVSVDAARNIITVNWDDRGRTDDREKKHTPPNDVEVRHKAPPPPPDDLEP